MGEMRYKNLVSPFLYIYLLSTTFVLRHPRRGDIDFLVYFLILF